MWTFDFNGWDFKGSKDMFKWLMLAAKDFYGWDFDDYIEHIGSARRCRDSRPFRFCNGLFWEREDKKHHGSDPPLRIPCSRPAKHM